MGAWITTCVMDAAGLCVLALLEIMDKSMFARFTGIRERRLSNERRNAQTVPFDDQVRVN
jgi:hypothetical protein